MISTTKKTPQTKISALALICLIALLSLPKAEAFFFEPIAAYHVDGSFKYPADSSGSITNGSADGDVSGFHLGLRTGVTFMADMLFLGVNLGFDRLTFDYSTSGLADDDASTFAVGAVGGVAFKGVPFRIWVGYNPTDKLEIDKGYWSNAPEYTGTSMFAGLGYVFKLGVPIQLGVEYTKRTYDEISLNGATESVPDTNVTTTSVVLSMPLTF